ncbi:hypothetical protein BC833DRAFT_590898 [Globomyces pollinis-pini]|nr:hypothetical protein BC833DRAFT_590898 [Globomyces pollinis-pini]
MDILATHSHALRSPSAIGNHVQACFSPDATLLFVPTSVLATDHSAIHQILANYAKQSHTILKEQILNTISTNHSIVQESILTIHHIDFIDWLLPGVKPTKKEIVLPLVTFYTLNDDLLISSKKLYWDQASVLRQVAVLPRSLYCKANASEVVLPISGANIGETLLEVSNIICDHNDKVLLEQDRLSAIDLANDQPESFNQGTDSYDNQNINSKYQSRLAEKSSGIFDDGQPHYQKPSTRVMERPGGKSSDIFGPPEPTQPSNRRDPNRSSINDEPTPTYRRQHSSAGNSSVFSADEPTIPSAGQRRDPNRRSISDESEEGHRPGQRQFSGQNTKSQFTLGNIEEGSIAQNSGKRMWQGSNSSTIDFGGEPTHARVGLTRRDPNAQSEQQTSRPSSRVLANPGGRSSFSFA